MSANDLISELLLGMRLCGVQFRRMEVPRPLGVGFSNEAGRAQFQFVGRGPVWLRSPAGELHRLDSGDAVLIPRGGQHAMLSRSDTLSRDIRTFDPAVPADDQPWESTEADQAAVIFSCCMTLELGGMQPLVEAMPEVMRVDTILHSSPEIRPLLDAMERESLVLLAGHAGILARLAEVIAALIVRGWVARGCGVATGWIGAMQDPRLSKALVMMHRHPGRPWTVASLASLASEAGQSRSVFAQRFLSATGVSPLRYLTDLRMRLAQQSLSHDHQAVEAVAEQLGYGSLAAFSRAFKRSVGVPPGSVRAGRRDGG